MNFPEFLLEHGTLGLWGSFDVRKRDNVFFSNFLDKQRMQPNSFASPRTRSCMQHKIPANTCILGVSYIETSIAH
jgi:hypothetical protein